MSPKNPKNPAGKIEKAPVEPDKPEARRATLFRQLDAADPAVRRVALEALDQEVTAAHDDGAPGGGVPEWFNARLEARLAELLADEEPAIQWAAADLLTRARQSWQYNTYHEAIDLLRGPDRAARLQGIQWLQRITEPDLVSDRDERQIGFALPALTVVTWVDDEEVALAALETINIAVEEDDVTVALPSLMRHLASPVDQFRAKAVIVLRSAIMDQHDRNAVAPLIPALESYLTDPLDPVKFGVADALTYHHARNRDWAAVKTLLRHPDKDVRQEAAGTLDHYSLPHSIRPLKAALRAMLEDPAEHDDVKIVATCAYLRTVYKNPEDLAPVVPVIFRALEHPDAEHRVYAANCLANLVAECKRFQKAQNGKRQVWEAITRHMDVIERAYADPEPKVRVLVARYMVPYYLRTGRASDLVQLLQAADPEMEAQIKKWITFEGGKQPAVLVDYLAGKDKHGLEARFRDWAKEGAQKVSLSGQPLNATKIYEIPPEVGLLTACTRLDLGGNHLRRLPPEIGRLKVLTYLVLSSNRLETLPPEIGDLERLEHLFLYRNALRALPPEIGNLKHLKYLQLIQNDLARLPGEIGGLAALEHLELSGNQLEALPPEIGNLTNLRFLDLRANDLTDLPAGFERLTNLEHLILDNNRKMHAIPPVVFELPKLTYLGFAYNGLTELPAAIGQLAALETLELRGNKLQHLPPEIGSLDHVRHLDLANNKLRALPPEITQMRGLKHLDVKGNALKLPAEVLRINTKPAEIFHAYFGDDLDHHKG